ncbi:hypothetical protein BJV77DRAFT_595135 [Russula vinacea]|nr:hypothetical protein BJV77DRAFT_595135 [Russula vinacea]
MVFSSHSTYHNRPMSYLERSTFGTAIFWKPLRFVSLISSRKTLRKHAWNSWKRSYVKIIYGPSTGESLEYRESDAKVPPLTTSAPSSTAVPCSISVLCPGRLTGSGLACTEFGSLSEHFESFIEHNFQGPLTIINFRVGVINARFCKALLAQFWNDLDHEGTVSFRSQWDVISSRD